MSVDEAIAAYCNFSSMGVEAAKEGCMAGFASFDENPCKDKILDMAKCYGAEGQKCEGIEDTTCISSIAVTCKDKQDAYQSCLMSSLEV